MSLPTPERLTSVRRLQDVYSQVAELVRERVRVEAENGEEAAALLLDQIDRKLVKQTVMTSVYGITFIGARDQIKRRLRERGWQSSGKYDNHQVAAYAAQVQPRPPPPRFLETPCLGAERPFLRSKPWPGCTSISGRQSWSWSG